MTGLLIGMNGVIKTGKSTFARSCAEIGKTAVAIGHLKEQRFYDLQEPHTITKFLDLDWRPHQKQFKATGYTKMLAWLDARAMDDTEFIIIDPANVFAELAQHEVLKANSASQPSELEYGRGYTGTDTLFKAMMIEVTRCAAKGKIVVMVFHCGMKEQEGAGVAKEQTTMAGNKELQFEERLMPVYCGTNKMAQTIGAPFDIWAYTKTSGTGPATKYLFTVVPDNVRPANHSVTFNEAFMKKTVQGTMVPNNMKVLLEGLA